MATSLSSSPSVTPTSVALLTAGHLFAGFAVGLGLALIVGSPMTAAFHVARNVVAGLIAVVCMSIAAAQWGRAIGQRTDAPDLRRATLAGALSFGPAIILVGLALTKLEQVIVEQGRGPALPVHVVYGMLFIPGSFAVASLSALILGVGLRRRTRDLARLALGSGVAASAAYLVIYLVMEWAGWRVGAPGASKRATMLVVTALGTFGAALGGGAGLGWVLSRTRATV